MIAVLVGNDAPRATPLPLTPALRNHCTTPVDSDDTNTSTAPFSSPSCSSSEV